MYIRCSDCKSSTWIEMLEKGEPPAGVSCPTCERRHDLGALAELGADGKARYERALACAESHQIDLPSAYSVLLGIMTLDDAVEVRDGRLTASEFARRAKAPALSSKTLAAPPPARMPASRIPVEEFAFDPGFNRAVADGLMTPKQAMERGDRDTLAARIAERHDLPTSMAYRIADNRVTLKEALTRRPNAEPEITGSSDPPVTRGQMVWVFGVATVLTVAAGLAMLWSGAKTIEPRPQDAATEETPATVEAASPSAEVEIGPSLKASAFDVRTDGQGRPLKISGPSPTSVLSAYCAANPRAHMLEPVELVPAVPPFPGTRLGIFRDFEGVEGFYAIQIHRDQRSSRWTAGDGETPIDVTVAPKLPPDATRIPVSAH